MSFLGCRCVGAGVLLVPRSAGSEALGALVGEDTGEYAASVAAAYAWEGISDDFLCDDAG